MNDDEAREVLPDLVTEVANDDRRDKEMKRKRRVQQKAKKPH